MRVRRVPVILIDDIHAPSIAMRTGLEKLNVKEIQQQQEKDPTVDCKDALTQAFAYLTSSEVGNFYARVLSTLDRYNAPGFGTMGVALKKGRYILLYDPQFVARVSYKELCATCEHEVLHIVLEHIPRYLRLFRLHQGSTNEPMMEIVRNLAQDLAANELLARNYPGVRNIESKPLGQWVVPHGFQPVLPDDLSMETYQELLLIHLKNKLKAPASEMLKLAKQMLEKSGQSAQNTLNPGQQGQGDPTPGDGQQGEGGGQPSPEELQQQCDDLDPVDQELLKMLLSAMATHAQWGAGDPETAADAEAAAHQAAEHGREVMKNALTNQKKLRGTIPGYMEELIRGMLTPPVVPWTQFLHNVIQKTRQTKKQRGMTRPSKVLSAMQKYVTLHADDESAGIQKMKALLQMKRMSVFPGTKHINKYTLFVAIDTSGSMGSEELKLAITELQHIQKADSDIRICVLYVDTRICTEYWIGPNDELQYQLTGRGGTDFDPVFEYVQERQNDLEKAPDLLVYITDGWAPAPTVRIAIPTVWLITPRGRPCCEEAGHITIPMEDYVVHDGI